MRVQTSCCTGNNTVNKLYYPLTDFWPKELPASNLGTLRFHINVPEMMQYYKGMLPASMQLEDELTKENIQMKDFGEMFNGEIVMTINVGKAVKSYDRDRKVPIALVALKLKDAKKAVDFMNRMASKNLEMSQYYKFDENGSYLLFGSDKKTFTTPTIKQNTTIPTLSTGHFGEVKMDIKGFIQAMQRDDRESRYSSYSLNELMANFFGKLEMTNDKSEDGVFIGDMAMELGDTDKNALTNIVDLIGKIIEQEQKRDAQYEIEYQERMQKIEAEQRKAARTTSKRAATTKKTVRKKK
jgi:hypothetical protein